MGRWVFGPSSGEVELRGGGVVGLWVWVRCCGSEWEV